MYRGFTHICGGRFGGRGNHGDEVAHEHERLEGQEVRAHRVHHPRVVPARITFIQAYVWFYIVLYIYIHIVYIDVVMYMVLYRGFT